MFYYSKVPNATLTVIMTDVLVPSHRSDMTRPERSSLCHGTCPYISGAIYIGHFILRIDGRSSQMCEREHRKKFDKDQICHGKKLKLLVRDSGLQGAVSNKISVTNT